MNRIIFFWLHLVVVIVMWTTPFWLDWKIILLLILLYYVQLIIFGNCILTIGQFNSREREETLYGFILEKIGFRINKKKMAKIADYILPWIILFLAVFIQEL